MLTFVATGYVDAFWNLVSEFLGIRVHSLVRRHIQQAALIQSIAQGFTKGLRGAACASLNSDNFTIATPVKSNCPTVLAKHTFVIFSNERRTDAPALFLAGEDVPAWNFTVHQVTENCDPCAVVCT